MPNIVKAKSEAEEIIGLPIPDCGDGREIEEAK